MKSCVIHTDLNPCGGAEQLSISTVQALLGMGIEVDLHVARKPDVQRLENAFGRERIKSIFERVGITLLGQLPIEIGPSGSATCAQKTRMEKYDLVVNTHADILPYYVPSFSAKKCMTYCHFPVAADYAIQRNTEYLKVFADLGLLSSEMAEAPGEFWRSFLEYYLLTLRNSHVVTNSNFSRRAIARWLKGEPATVIAPPVGVEEFRSALSYRRNDTVLVVSRINRSKKLEKALTLAQMLKRKGIGGRMIIAGNLSPDDRFGCAYYLQLENMIAQHGLSGYVKILLNVEFEKLQSLMGSSSVYFHPLEEEPFGISVVEAISAGLVPVVPNVGGPVEFVPEKYQYGSLEEAAGIVRSALEASIPERLALSDSVRDFSTAAYIRRFQSLVREKLAMDPVVQPVPRVADGIHKQPK